MLTWLRMVGNKHRPRTIVIKKAMHIHYTFSWIRKNHSENSFKIQYTKDESERFHLRILRNKHVEGKTPEKETSACQKIQTPLRGTKETSMWTIHFNELISFFFYTRLATTIRRTEHRGCIAVSCSCSCRRVRAALKKLLSPTRLQQLHTIYNLLLKHVKFVFLSFFVCVFFFLLRNSHK